MADSANIVILGASGYTGAELIRLLVRHPRVHLQALTADRNAGKTVAEVFPHLADIELPDLVAFADVDFTKTDFVFCALPHGTTQDIIASLPKHVKICDLSADFRFADVETYAKWYGDQHRAPALQAETVYGLTELARDAVAKARVVANPGCYPTSAQLPLIPLLRSKLIESDPIIVDSKSGASGAGRSAKEGSLHTEVSEGIHAYGVASHRHAPEIDQGLSKAAGKVVTCAFTPHLMPMNRGILSTIYVRMTDGVTVADLHSCLSGQYRDDPFVRILPTGSVPHTRHVRGSNLCVVGVVADRRPNWAIVVSVIDNLVKGASGQAVQNMNVMMGYPETMGLTQAPLFP